MRTRAAADAVDYVNAFDRQSRLIEDAEDAADALGHGFTADAEGGVLRVRACRGNSDN